MTNLPKDKSLKNFFVQYFLSPGGAGKKVTLILFAFSYLFIIFLPGFEILTKTILEYKTEALIFRVEKLQKAEMNFYSIDYQYHINNYTNVAENYISHSLYYDIGLHSRERIQISVNKVFQNISFVDGEFNALRNPYFYYALIIAFIFIVMLVYYFIK